MRQQIGYSGHDGNITLQFFQDKEPEVAKIRKALYKRLYEYHPSISIAVKKMLEDRTRKSPAPLLGELLPHILNTMVTGIDQAIFNDIAVQWMAAYSLTVIADNSVDAKEEFNGALLAPLHLEASKLQKHVAGTKYAQLFEQLTFESVKNYLREVKLAGKKGYVDQKMVVAKEKGKIYSALATVFAAQISNKREQAMIMDFTDNLLLSFQMFDDIADYDNDYEENNKTVMLSNVKGFNLNRRAILKQIIDSGALETVATAAMTSLQAGLKSLPERNKNLQYVKKYLIRLFQETIVLKRLIMDYKFVTGIPRKQILGKIENKMQIVCQST